MKHKIIGADETGLGSWASSVVVCAVSASNDWSIVGLNDSKKLTDKKRRELNEELLYLAQSNVIQFCIAERSNDIIDEIGIYPALKECYKEACSKLYTPDTLIIIDGNMKFNGYLDEMDYQTFIKADTKVPTVMAASIIGKVWRDNKMIELHNELPQYNFKCHKGYGSKEHLEMINKYGVSKYHRKSYAPIKERL